jgi:hypothetical protein
MHGCQRQLTVDAVLELAFVLRAVEAPFRFGNEPIIVDLPKLVSADANALSSAAGPVVRARDVQWNFVPSESRVTLSIITTMSGKSRMNPRTTSAIAARPTAGAPSFTQSEPFAAKNAATLSGFWLHHAFA